MMWQRHEMADLLIFCHQMYISDFGDDKRNSKANATFRKEAEKKINKPLIRNNFTKLLKTFHFKAT